MPANFITHAHLLGLFRIIPRRARKMLFSRRYRRQIDRTGEAELPQLRKFVSSGDLCLDIGANLGTYAYELGRLTGNCIAFEPNPRLAGLLRSLCLEGVIVRQLAIADFCGNAEFSVPDSRFGHALGHLKRDASEGDGTCTYIVPTMRIDDLDLPKVRFIKIDVEGFEEAALRGAIETIARDKPTLLIEIEERQNPGGIERISKMLSCLGYRGFFYDGQWVPLSKFDPKIHQRSENDDPAGRSIRRQLRFFNNFLFSQDDHS